MAILIEQSLDRLDGKVSRTGLAGYDPYDALASPWLNALSQKAHLMGRVCIQALRLLPLNLRPFLGIRPEFDAKTLGLFARAYLLLDDTTDECSYWQSADECLEILADLTLHDFSGACWAHPFPYRSSRSYLPADFPTVVSTVYAAQAFLDGYERGGAERWLEIGRSSCDFILEDLSRIGNEEQFCFSYYPGVELAVHNASLLAADLLARVARLTGETELLKPLRAAVRYTLADQQPDGSWLYDGPESPARANTFVDGFHTGFVLESLWDIQQESGMDLKEPLTRGLRFYLEHLFEPSGQPRRLVNRLWPLDLRDCAQAIIVLSRLRELDTRAEEMLHRVASWTIRNMQAPDGYFYYLRWKWFITPIPYIRFQAWMMVALARYQQAIGNAEK